MKYGPKPIDPKVRFMNKVVVSDGCWEWTGTKNNQGYGMFMFASPKKIPASRAAWIIFNGQIGKYISVCHRCDNPGCVNPSHLFVGTHAQNMKDMRDKGRHKCVGHPGTKNGASKLNDEKVREIRRLGTNRTPHKDISRMFGVSCSNISHVLTRRTWGHVS